jgi:hypothetical protein
MGLGLGLGVCLGKRRVPMPADYSVLSLGKRRVPKPMLAYGVLPARLLGPCAGRLVRGSLLAAHRRPACPSLQAADRTWCTERSTRGAPSEVHVVHRAKYTWCTEQELMSEVHVVHRAGANELNIAELEIEPTILDWCTEQELMSFRLESSR